MKKIIPFFLLLTLLLANGHIELGKNLFKERKFNKAKKAFLDAIKKNDKSAEAFYFLAKIHFYQDELDSAIEYCESAIELVDDNAEYHFWMGRLYGMDALQSNIFKKISLANNILEHFEKSVELDSNHVGGNVGLAQFYWHAPGIVGGDVDKAISIAKRVVELEKIEGYNLLANIYVSEDRPTEAMAEIEKFISVDELRGRLLLARFHLRNEKNREAENQMKKIESLVGDNSDYFWFFNNYGYFLLEQDRYDEAIQKFKKQVLLAPHRANPHDSLAEALIAAGRESEALASLKKALEINPELESVQEKIIEIEENLSSN